MMPLSFLTGLADLVLGKLGHAIEIATFAIALGDLPMLLACATLVGGMVLLHRPTTRGETASRAVTPDQSTQLRRTRREASS